MNNPYAPFADNLETLHGLKRQFAEGLLREPDESFKIAFALFPQAPGIAMQASAQWPSDQFVLDTQKKLLAEQGSLAFLPDKERIARELYAKTKTGTNAEQMRAYAQYIELMGFVPKVGPQFNQQNNFGQPGGGSDSNKVMVVPNSGSDEKWQNDTIEQQRQLQAAAMGDHERHQ